MEKNEIEKKKKLLFSTEQRNMSIKMQMWISQ
jgi:hypothetical protein